MVSAPSWFFPHPHFIVHPVLSTQRPPLHPVDWSRIVPANLLLGDKLRGRPGLSQPLQHMHPSRHVLTVPTAQVCAPQFTGPRYTFPGTVHIGLPNTAPEKHVPVCSDPRNIFCSHRRWPCTHSHTCSHSMDPVPNHRSVATNLIYSACFFSGSCVCVCWGVDFLLLSLSGYLSNFRSPTPAVFSLPAAKAEGGWAGLVSMATKDPPPGKEKVLGSSIGFCPGLGSEWG